MNDKADTAPLTRFLGPRYWPTWLGYACIWAAAQLPLRWQMGIGHLIGLAGYRFARGRRHTCATNIALCFPELSAAEQDQLVRETFIANGKGIMEIGLSWCRDPADFMDGVSVEGLDNLRRAQEQGRGVLLVSAHFCTLEIIGALFAQLHPIGVTYRAHKNPLFNALMLRGRRRHLDALIERRQVRRALRRLKQGHVLWYAADQDYGPRHSVFAEFFGVPAATITATSQFAGFNNSPVVFLAHYRKPGDAGYELYLSQPLDNFPSGDDQADAQRINDLIEEAIRYRPEQYIWLHRRFKTRPPGEPDPYSRRGGSS